MSAATTTRKKMGLVTIVGSIFIVASLVWGLYSFILIQGGVVRQYEPHYEYNTIDYWPYTNNFTGGITNWFENLNYTDFQLDQPLPDNILDRLNDTIFVVTPKDPGQLWRQESYDYYDGAGWSKTDTSSPRALSSEELIPASEATNVIYTVIFKATAGAEVGTIELPTLFPAIRVIEGSFKTYSIVDGIPVEDNPSRFIHLELATDSYGTLLLSPIIEGNTGEDVPVSFDITFVTQNLANVVANALPGSAAPAFSPDYTQYPDLTQRVKDNISQFLNVGDNAYEKAMAVKTYFQSTFELNLTPEALLDYPQNQEVTDWFLERGNGLPQHFATAYAVFMRYLGIPARVVSGYALGEPDPVEDFRTVMVKHMTFWDEVYIPTSTTEGEWIQVVPVPVPAEYQGDEIPVNTPVPDIQLLVWPSNGRYYADIGVPFNLSAVITVDGMPVTTPDIVSFRDVTDSQFIGTATIGQSPNLPIANVTYAFPVGATVSYHIMSATWVNSYFQVMNATAIFAVGVVSPLRPDTRQSDGFIISETQELNVSQGLDTYVAYWNDTVHVFGTMKVNGAPFNSSEYNNQYIQIMWDNAFMGNAHIDEYGYYELDIYVDPTDFSLMKVGPHEVWCWYLGDWDGPTLRIHEARSSDNSTVAVWGGIQFELSVAPTLTFPGGSVNYEGTISFLNGTILPAGQTIGVFFGAYAETASLNTTGGFQWSYDIPLAQAYGTYFARANWTNSLNWPYIAGNWSRSIPVDVGASGTNISVNALPDPLFIGQKVTIRGYLTHIANGTGIGGCLVDIWWSTGATINLGSATTAGNGYFEFNYTIPIGYEGPVEYWANFTSGESALASSELQPHLFSTIKRYDVSISIFVAPNPARLLQTVTIQGVATLPENGSIPLSFSQIRIWWGNSTGDYNIGTAFTNSTGGFMFYYQVPISHNIEIVTVWANYTTLFPNIADGGSIPEPLSIETTTTLITVQEDIHTYHLNETALLYGTLRFSNGTPIAFQKVFIHWVNASGAFVYETFTNSGGNYQFQYNFSIYMSTGTIDVYVNWTSGTPLIADAYGTLVPSIQVIRYDVQISLIVPAQIYVDEGFIVQGVLTFDGGAPPISGATIYISYYDGNQWLPIQALITNSTGGFMAAPISFGDFNESTYSFAAVYLSSDPLINNHTEYFDISRIKYSVNVDISVPTNPVKLNETVMIHVYLYFQQNGTPIVNADVSIYWYNGTLYLLGNITTDGTGQADLYYSGMDYDTVRNNVEVYAYYAGTILRAEAESSHILLTLEQWLTEVYNLGTDFPTYRLTETVIVTGNLRYILPAGPYAGVPVELLLLGVPLNSTVTASDGSFTLYWTIPKSTPVGFYDLVVRFQSSYPWIAGSQATAPQIEIVAPGYIWVSFNVSPSSPTQAYLLEYLQISGTVIWDNGSFYGNSQVSIYWGNPLGTWLMRNVTTNAIGGFIVSYQIPGNTSLGNRQVWAYIPPVGYATFGMSPTRDIIVARYSVIITAYVDVTTVHLGEQITFYGTAAFSNGTPLDSYDIEIWWNGNLTSTESINSGTFSYQLNPVPYSMSVGIKSGYVFFNAPTAAFLDIAQNFQDVTVREYVNLYLDSQPADTDFIRGETIVVTGYVRNDGNQLADGVNVRVVLGSVPTAATGFTGSNGRFSISYDISRSQVIGAYTLTIDSIGPYQDVLSSPLTWTISIYRSSIVNVMITTGGAFMPGEYLSLTLELHDDYGDPISGVTIQVYLNDTLIAAPTLLDGNGQNFDLAIPTLWTGGSGVFAVRAEYNGAPFTYGDTSEAAQSIHIFTQVQFSLRSATRIDPQQQFVIEIVISDPNGQAIENRDARLILNRTSTIQTRTDSNGRITYNSQGFPDGTILYFTVRLTSLDNVADVVSDEFQIRIQTQGGIILQGTDLIIAGILLIGAVIAVLAYLYIVRGMFRAPVISRGVDIPSKLRNIKKLADAGKYGASITLAYRTFEQMCGTKIGSERTHSETAREYLDRVLQSIPLDASTLEQFVLTYEEARFSHHEMTRERYEAALRVFTDLYPRIDSTVSME